MTDKQYSTCHDSLKTTMQKNLIVALQAHLLFEGCLVKDDEDNLHQRKKKTFQVHVHLQRIIGIPSRHPTDYQVILSLLKAYATARENAILRSIANGKEPTPPNSRLNALLHMLIDRYLVFHATFTAIRKSPEFLSFHFRIHDRCKVMSRALEAVKSQATDEEGRWIESVIKEDEVKIEEAPDSLCVRLVPMVPSAELQPYFTKPWFVEEWLRKHLREEDWPSKVRRVTVEEDNGSSMTKKERKTENKRVREQQRDGAANVAQQDGDTAATAQQPVLIVVQPEPTSTQQSLTPGSKSASQDKGMANKRKRDEDEASDAEGRGKVTNVETTYFAMGELVFWPK